MRAKQIIAGKRELLPPPVFILPPEIFLLSVGTNLTSSSKKFVASS